MSARRLSLVVAFAAVAMSAAAVDDLSVARQALRDGLWEVARAHAGTGESEEAKLIVLESYANEGRWQDVEKLLSMWGDSLKSPGFGYYRAMVAGDWAQAVKLLKDGGAWVTASGRSASGARWSRPPTPARARWSWPPPT